MRNKRAGVDAEAGRNGSTRAAAGVQSVERTFALLESMAEAGGLVGLSRLAEMSGLPLPTIHRLIRTLVALGYVRQEPSREYSLGPRLVWLGESASRQLGVWAKPYLARLVDELGESANLALLDGSEVVYVAQVPGRHSMRMFTEVGRRVSPHCTAVGKALLARLDDQEIDDLISRMELVKHTERTITDPSEYRRELDRVRARGYATDEGELELGVRCVAVALGDGPVRAALSLSGPTVRMSDQLVARAVPHLQSAARALAVELAEARGTRERVASSP